MPSGLPPPPSSPQPPSEPSSRIIIQPPSAASRPLPPPPAPPKAVSTEKATSPGPIQGAAVGVALPPPPVTPPPAPRKPLSKNTKLALLSCGLLVALVIGGYFVWKKITSRPSDSVVLVHLNQVIGSGRVQFSRVERQDNVADDGSVSGTFSAVGTVKEPLYAAVDTASYLQKELKVDVMKLDSSRKLLTGPGGARIRELAGSVEEPANPLKSVIIEEKTAAAIAVTYQGSFRALHTSGAWTFDVTGNFQQPQPLGETRNHYQGKTYLTGDSTDVAALRTLVQLCADYSQRISTAHQQYLEERRRTRDERLVRYASLFQSGTLYMGSASSRRGQEKAVLTLEIVDQKAGGRQVTALVRNDGGWSDARMFQGEWRTDADAETLSLLLGTRSNQAIRDAGPILDTVDSWNIAFQVDSDGNLSGATDSFEYKFVKVPTAEVARVKAELTASHTAVLAATAVGQVYQGEVVSKYGQNSEIVTLRFAKQDNNGAVLVAMIESLDHAAWRRTLRGFLIGNRYRGGDHPVRLKLSRGDEVRRAEGSSIFAHGGELTPAFEIQGDQLVGEDGAYTYRLTRLSPEQVNQLAADRHSREQRFFSVVRSGANYDGTARDGNGYIGRVRLRFVAVDSSEGSVTVAIDSREQTGIFHEWKGSFDVAEGSLALGSSGRGRYNPSGVLHVPFLSRETIFRINLVLDDSGFSGAIVDQGDWKLVFPVKAQVAPAVTGGEIDPATGLPIFPSMRGAYVLVDGRWQAMPTNEGKVTYGVAEVLNGVSDLLGALSGRQPVNQVQSRPDKLASLTFRGRQPVPSVGGRQVIIAYVGEGKRPDASVLQQYPELRDYPDIELAPTRTNSDGSRQVDLLRIAPGFAGFRDQRVAAILDPSKTGVLLMTCTGSLDSGTYALSAGTEAYELIVN